MTTEAQRHIPMMYRITREGGQVKYGNLVRLAALLRAARENFAPKVVKVEHLVVTDIVDVTEDYL